MNRSFFAAMYLCLSAGAAFAVDISLTSASSTAEVATFSTGYASWNNVTGVYVGSNDLAFGLCPGSLGAVLVASYAHLKGSTQDGFGGSLGSYNLVLGFESSAPVNAIYRMCITSEVRAGVAGEVHGGQDGLLVAKTNGGLAQNAEYTCFNTDPANYGNESSGSLSMMFFVPVNFLYTNSTSGSTTLYALGTTSTFFNWGDVVPVLMFPIMSGECVQQVEDLGRVTNGRVPKLPPPDHSGPFEKDFRGMAAFAEWRTPNTTTIVGHGLITELGNGDLPIGCEGDGTYDLSIKPRGCLRMTNEVTVSSISLTLPQLDFIRGDIDEDNYIGTDDYIVLSDYFDKTDEDADWFLSSADHVASPYDADINADGSVGTDDYLIMSDNWDLAGDD